MSKKNTEKTLMRTPFGTLRLAKKDAARLKKTVMELQRTTDSLTRKDMGDWRQAWQRAVNVDSPNRQPLYDIYRDVEVDLHLSGCIQQREGFVLSRSFKLVNENGDEDEEAIKYFNTSWFKLLMKLALDANYWGHSLIELGYITTDINGRQTYDGVKLIPRKHVIPEYHRVVPDLGQDWKTGIDYHDTPFADWLIEVGQPDSLGLYLKAATQTIPKKNALAFWDTFAEIFGMYLGKGLAAVGAVVNPEAFVIGGGVSKAGEVLFDYIEKNYMKYSFHGTRNVKFRLATLGNDAGIYGAAKLIVG